MMAEVKIYRAAIRRSGDPVEDEPIRFSSWVIADGIDEATTALEAENESSAVTIIGWEEKKLDTEP